MPRRPTPLSATQVKQARPKSKEYNLADGDGLALRIKPNGTKLWLFNYTRPHTSSRSNISLGVFPDVPLSEARTKRQKLRELVAKNIDPKQSRDNEKVELQAKNETTLRKVAGQWFELKQKKVTDAHADDIIRSLDNHIMPRLGRYPISEIKPKLVIDTLKPLVQSGKLEMIKRICQRLNEVMIWAANTGLIGVNPLAGIRHAFETPTATNNPTIKPDRIPELLTAINNAKIRDVTRYLILWQLHTMTRPSEAAGARWDEIDSSSKVWVIPSERMKKRRPHSIPLTQAMLDILDSIKPISSKGEFVFPSDIQPGKCANSSTANVALKRMGFQGLLTAHGMRALASTTLNEHGFDSELIEAALAHVDQNQVRSAYNRAEYIERRRGMMEWWCTQLKL